MCCGCSSLKWKRSLVVGVLVAEEFVPFGSLWCFSCAEAFGFSGILVLSFAHRRGVCVLDRRRVGVLKSVSDSDND